MSTSDPLIRIEREASYSLTTGNFTVAILIDFTRAFDLLWVDGLLLKLLQLKIQGRICNWIHNFLTNRKNVVKIGESLSQPFTTENGTPQGSSISPILFIIMINDFPVLSEQTNDAFFADDCSIWRSGKNLEQIFYHLQLDLDRITEWCNKWGFIINAAKTQGIIFTKKNNIKTSHLKLTIDQIPIQFSNTVKLLGIHMDSKLTFKGQVESLVKNSKIGLNLMRAVSGTDWGGNKRTLPTIHKSFILSRLEYCSFVYLNCSKSLTNKLDTIQYKALKIASGALLGTSRNSLLSECGELPLQIRRDQSLIKYLLKISNSINNAASSVLNDIKYWNLQSKSHSKYKAILNDFLKQVNIKLEPSSSCFKQKPWSVEVDKVDISLTELEVQESSYFSVLFVLMQDLTDTHDCVLYVDGSVRMDGKVGSAVFSPSLDLKLMFKLPDGFSIYYAEAFAILQALLVIKNRNIHSFCIISDSLQVLKHLKYQEYNSSPYPNILLQILQLLNLGGDMKAKIKWIPAHCCIPHCDTADKLAKLASSLQHDNNIVYFKEEASSVIKNWVRVKWDREWVRDKSSQYQNNFELQKTLTTLKAPRRVECIWYRLRLMQSKLNACLFKIGKHSDGLCTECNIKEDCTHFLLNCKKNRIAEEGNTK